MQGGGETLDPFRADRIFALDERLTRRFEKTLAMLIKLREIRLAGSVAAEPRRKPPPYPKSGSCSWKLNQLFLRPTRPKRCFSERP